MKLWFLPLAAPLVLATAAAQNRALASDTNDTRHAYDEQSTAGERTLLDLGWKFHLGNSADPSQDFGYGIGSIYAKSGEGVGPIRPGFDDATWRNVDLPHDWAVELPFEQEGADLVSHGFKPLGSLYPATSIGWYRKRFTVPAGSAGKHFRIDFDGVFRDARVWLNGHYLGEHESGYSGFSFDINDWLNYTGRNTLTVRVDATQNEGWFYEGAGIYRHVWLAESDPIHIAKYGVYVVPTVTGTTGRLKIYTAVENDSDVAASLAFTYELVGPDGRATSLGNLGLGPKVAPVREYGPTAGTAARESLTKNEGQLPSAEGYSVAPHGTTVRTLVTELPNVQLWSIEHPNLYHLRVRMAATGKDTKGIRTFADEQDTSLGFRTIKFDKDRGFFLNGEHVLIKGTCNHQDHAGVGSAVPDAINEYRVRRLKEMGANAYRTSHNDPTASIIDACDKLGMLVMDEHRLMDSNPETLADLQELVRRDRNHPSVIIWSIGNEEPIQNTEVGHRIALSMKRAIHQLDQTRPISCAANNGNGYAGVNEVMDIRGWNYIAIGDTDAYHAAHPEQPMYGSEEASTLSTRGIYVNDPERGYMSSYDVNNPSWGATAEHWWKYYMARPYLAGAFVWTGFDYRGEPTPYQWPCISSHFGIMDTCGFPKDNYYYYQAQWLTTPVLHILPHWTWPGSTGKPVEVWVQTNCEEAELFVNGVSQGRKKVEPHGHAVWNVTYAPGMLEAKGYKDGQIVRYEVVKTAGAPSKIVLTPDRPNLAADGEDAEVVNVSVVDKDGNPTPIADNRLQFDIDGAARIVGVGNGDPSDHDPDVYPPKPQGFAIENWTMAPAPFDVKPGDTFDIKPIGDARRVTVQRDAVQIRRENAAALFSAEFEVTREQLEHGVSRLTIGGIDDEGWIYLNGKLLAHVSDWSASFDYDVSKLLKSGSNTLQIYVKNFGGRGGLGRGVGLSGPDIQAKYTRRLFNGLAQVILRAGTKAGTARLTASSEGLGSATTEIVVEHRRLP